MFQYAGPRSDTLDCQVAVKKVFTRDMVMDVETAVKPTG
jgi:hypothetical protein